MKDNSGGLTIMAMFDIIEASGYGYRLAWQERHYLARLATIPALVKWICVFVILKAGWPVYSFKSILLLLPCFFAEGWMYAHYTRLIFLDQRWPFRPSGDAAADRQDLMERAHYLMAGTLTYVLFQVLMRGLFVFELALYSHAAMMAQHQPPQMPMPVAIMFLTSAVFVLWFIRMIWFYIPASIGYSLRQCVRDLRGMMTSVLILLATLICSVPLWVVAQVIESSLGNYDFSHANTLPTTILIFVSMLESVFDTAIGLILTGAMSYAFYEMISLRRGPASGKSPRS